MGWPGTSVGRSWIPLGRFVDVQIKLFSSMGPRWAPRCHLGSILDGFGKGFGRAWVKFGEGFWDVRDWLLWDLRDLRHGDTLCFEMGKNISRPNCDQNHGLPSVILQRGARRF